MTEDELLEEWISQFPEYPLVKGNAEYREALRDTVSFKWYVLGYYLRQPWSEIRHAFGFK